MPTLPKRCTRRLTPESLDNAALFYLERYAASEASLRRVLLQKIRRAALRDEAFADDKAAQDSLRAHVETIIEKHRRLGVLNDESYAAMKVAGLRRAGGSKRKIEQKLAQKGVSASTIAQALTQEDEDSEEAELKAARAFAKKKRLGNTPKAVATMARAGFSFDVVRKILGDLGDEGDLGD